MSINKDDNDNEQKNIDTYKVLGDQMARKELNYSNQEKSDEDSFLITYQDLAAKIPNKNPNLKMGGTGETKNKGKVRFGEVIKATPHININKKSSKKEINKNKNSKNDKMRKSEKILSDLYKKNNPINKNDAINPNVKKSNTNYVLTNSSKDININSETLNNKKSNKDNVYNVTKNNDLIKYKKSITKKNSNQNNDIILNKKSNRNIVNDNSNNINNDKNNNPIPAKGSLTNFTNSINYRNNPIKKTSTNKSNYSNSSSNNNNYKNNTNNNINMSISQQNNNNQNTTDDKNNKSLYSEDLEPIEIEFVNPNELEDESNDSSFNPSNIENRIFNKGRQTLYEREMNNLRKKRNRLDKERILKIQKICNNLQDGPAINEKSHQILANLGEYVPIQDRAAQIHSRYLTRIILNEELIRLERQNKEDQEYEKIRQNKLKRRKYEKEKWDKFVESCFKWKEEVNYKRKAAEIFRINMEKKVNYKPRINLRSKQIMKKMQKGSHSVDNVFNRLYNDYEEHKERQKILDEEYYLPLFTPKISNIKYFNRKANKRKNGLNHSFDRFVTDSLRNNFFLESQIKANGGKINNNKNNKVKNVKKYLNKNKSFDNIQVNKNKNIIKNKIDEKRNKNYKSTLATNNSTIFINTEGNTLPYSRYITTENPLLTETTHNYIPTLPENNFFYEYTINEMSEISSIEKDNKNYLKNNNFFADIHEEEIVNYNNNVDNMYNNYNINYKYNIINYRNNSYIKPNNNEYFVKSSNYNNNNINDNPYKKKKRHSLQSKEKSLDNSINNIIKKNIISKNQKTKKKKNSKINVIVNNEEEDDNINTSSTHKSNNKNHNKSYDKSNCDKSIDRSNDKSNRHKSNKSIDKVNVIKKANDKENNVKNNKKNKETIRNQGILEELNNAQIKKYKENQIKHNNNENNKEKSDNSLYRLNIRDTTPDNIKENVIIPTDKYNDFFNIEGINDL